MKNRSKYLLPGLAFAATLSNLTIPNAVAGSESHGGDVARCVGEPSSPFEGLYSLDFLLTYDPRFQNSDIMPVESWKEARTRLRALLQDKLPSWVGSFDEFVASIEQTNSRSARTWSPAPAGLVDIKDERMIRLLPTNCRGAGDGSAPKLYQAVVRENIGSGIHYDYDYKILAELKERQPLQYSFLMVHEWLWDLTEDVRVIRLANRLLHSREFAEMTPAASLAAMKNLGLIAQSDENSLHYQLSVEFVTQVLARDAAGVSRALARGASPTEGFWFGDNARYLIPFCPTPEQSCIPKILPYSGNALDMAIAMGEIPVIEVLLQAGLTPVSDQMNYAFLNDHLEAVHFLEQRFHFRWLQDGTALKSVEVALQQDSLSKLNSLIEMGLSPKTVGAATAAAKWGSRKAVQLFAGAGVDFTLKQATALKFYESSSNLGCLTNGMCLEGYLKSSDPLLTAALAGNVRALEAMIVDLKLSPNSLSDVLVEHQRVSARGYLEDVFGIDTDSYWTHSNYCSKQSALSILSAALKKDNRLLNAETRAAYSRSYDYLKKAGAKALKKSVKCEGR